MVAQWWWTVDRWMLAAVIALAFIGAILVLAASPAVATRIGMDSFALVRRHYAMLPLALGTVVFISMLSAKQVRRLGVILFFVFFALTALTLFCRRRDQGCHALDLARAALPAALRIPEALLCDLRRLDVLAAEDDRPVSPATSSAIGAYLATVALLLKQPDLGMTAVVTATWAAQFFIAGLPIFWVLLLVGLRCRRPRRRLFRAAARD